jgi:hypothetical protein
VTQSLYTTASDPRRITIASQLTKLVSRNEHPVRKLANQLRGSGHVDLGGASLAEMYPPEIMLPTGTPWLRWPTEVLELIRDVLIFVPVIYTWWQLAKALQAWQHYKGTDTFLLAWQEGFPQHGHDLAQPLSSSALTVASVVSAVIILTLIAHLFRVFYDKNVQHRQRTLAGLLAEATLILNESLITAAPDVSKKELADIGIRISASTKALNDALTKSSADIVGAVNANPGSKLHDMFKQWTDMAATWAKSADELHTMGARLNGTQEVVAQLRDTQAALTGMQERIQNETTRLLQAMEHERALSAQEAYAHHQVATQVEQATQNLAGSLVGLSERAETFNEMVLRLRTLVHRLDGLGDQDGGYA